eukprot:COSAG01_NODE_6271_length_3755_cov_5.711633_2_plen_113_part_00
MRPPKVASWVRGGGAAACMHAPCLLALLALLNCSAALYEESLRAAARLMMMHDRLLGRLTCNLLSVTVLDGGLSLSGRAIDECEEDALGRRRASQEHASQEHAARSTQEIQQ